MIRFEHSKRFVKMKESNRNQEQNTSLTEKKRCHWTYSRQQLHFPQKCVHINVISRRQNWCSRTRHAWVYCRCNDLTCPLLQFESLILYSSVAFYTWVGLGYSLDWLVFKYPAVKHFSCSKKGILSPISPLQTASFHTCWFHTGPPDALSVFPPFPATSSPHPPEHLLHITSLTPLV